MRRGLTWTGIERVGSYALRFLIGLVMARLLVPSDYGLIGMLGFFLALGEIFQDCGFQSALIQKKDRSEVDYSTVFWFNLAAASLLALLFIAGAPLIAGFYNMPQLELVTRVMALGFVVNALSMVQRTRLSVTMRFGVQSIISMVSLLVSGALGIFLAWRGWGVWALVWQILSCSVLTSVLSWFVVGWYPRLAFSRAAFAAFFGFGSKVVCSSVINSVYANLYTLVIGRFFGAAEIGYYNRADGFAGIPAFAFNDVILKVNYPVLAKVQDDDVELRRRYCALLFHPQFWLVPILFGMAALAEPMVFVLVGEKWLACVPYLQVLCFAMLFHPLTHINLNLLYVKGRTDLVLKLELIKKPLGFLILFASIPFGLFWMCVGRAAYALISYFFDSYYMGRFLGYGFCAQMRDFAPLYLNGVLMVTVIGFVSGNIGNPLLRLLIGGIAGAGVYLGVGWLCTSGWIGRARKA